jgi:hypothetical protein
MNFINTAMFYAAVEPDFGQHSSKAAGESKHDANDMPDIDSAEVIYFISITNAFSLVYLTPYFSYVD